MGSSVYLTSSKTKAAAWARAKVNDAVGFSPGESPERAVLVATTVDMGRVKFINMTPDVQDTFALVDDCQAGRDAGGVLLNQPILLWQLYLLHAKFSNSMQLSIPSFF